MAAVVSRDIIQNTPDSRQKTMEFTATLERVINQQAWRERSRADDTNRV